MSRLEKLIHEYCPNGVEYYRFCDIATYVRGVSYNKTQEVNNSSNGYKLLRANNIDLASNTLNYNDLKIIDYSVKVKDTQYLMKDDILICAGSGSKEHIGKVAFSFNDTNYTFGGFMGVIRVNKELIDPRYMFHILTGPIFKNHLQSVSNSSTINNINNDTWKDFEVPLPALPVQREIVHILDEFSLLSAELAAELAARKKQFEFYRDFVFAFDDTVKYRPLSELAEIGTGSRNTRDAVENGEYDFYVRSPYPLKHNQYDFDDQSIITAGDGVGVGKVFHLTNGKYALHQRAYRIHPNNSKVINVKYLYYYFTANFYDYINGTKYKGSVASIRLPMLRDFLIPTPSMSEQMRIIDILDCLDTLANNIFVGLPSEIEARQKQYEYYRDKLLSFKRL